MAAAWVLLLGLARSASADDCAAEAGATAWPVPTWTTAAPAGDPAAVRRFEDYAFPEGLDEAARTGVRTNGLVVVQDGRIVYERYARGFTADRPHIAWSVTKSVVHGLFGRAVQSGVLESLDQPAARWVPTLAVPGKDRITLAHLLAMSSGLGFNEEYEYAPLRSSVIAMLYTRGHDDMAAFAAGHPLVAEPGTTFAYKSGDSVILMAALRGIVGAEAYPDYPWRALFAPLGMRSVVFEQDDTGTFVGSSYLYATPRDLARYGLLYAEGGCWAGERLLPEGWTAAAGRLAPALAQTAAAGRRRTYGAHWWLNRPLPGRSDPPLPAAPTDLLVGSGHWGQRLFVLPSQGLVIVRTGDDRREGL
jgi:CubicO group peptidase (beta-lactamase class C family)